MYVFTYSEVFFSFGVFPTYLSVDYIYVQYNKPITYVLKIASDVQYGLNNFKIKKFT